MANKSSETALATRFIESLSTYTKAHRARHWEGTFGQFLAEIFPRAPRQLARTSHEYIWEMFRQHAGKAPEDKHSKMPAGLFRQQLFGIDPALDRVIEYFKAASAGSDVGRQLLLLLGPPSGGKSTLVILLKRALEEYSHTDEGAIYALKGSPLHESPLNLVPVSLRGEFRETYGVDIEGELSPHGRVRLEEEFDGDMEDDELTREGWDRRGARSRLDRRRSVKEAIKRRAIQPDGPAFINDDLCYRQLVTRQRPATRAVVFFALDVSSSMSEQERQLAKTFFFWVVQGLRRQYKRIEPVFIAHTTVAWEFAEPDLGGRAAQWLPPPSDSSRKFWNNVTTRDVTTSTCFTPRTEKTLARIMNRHWPCWVSSPA